MYNSLATVGQVKGSIQLVLAYVVATVIIVAAVAYLIVSSQKKKNPKPPGRAGGTPPPEPLSTAGKVGVVLAAVFLAACSVSCAHLERHAIKKYKPYAAFTALS